MSGLDTSQPMTDEVSLHAAEHHAHSRPHDGEPTDAEKPSAKAVLPEQDAEHEAEQDAT